MSEDSVSTNQDNVPDHPAVDALARFLMTYDLTEAADLPEGFQPIVSSTLQRVLNDAINDLEESERQRNSVVHGFQRIALEELEIDGKTWVFAGLAPVDLEERIREAERQATEAPSKAEDSAEFGPAPAFAFDGDEDSDAPSFKQNHFRGLRGEFYSMRPRELIQFFCTCGATVEVRFVSNLGETGQVLIEKGTVIHVEAEGVMGELAIGLVMDWESGDFSTRPLRESPPHTISSAWMHFLLDHAKTIDESGEFTPVTQQEVRDETLDSLPGWMDT